MIDHVLLGHLLLEGTHTYTYKHTYIIYVFSFNLLYHILFIFFFVLYLFFKQWLPQTEILSCMFQTLIAKAWDKQTLCVSIMLSNTNLQMGYIYKQDVLTIWQSLKMI